MRTMKTSQTDCADAQAVLSLRSAHMLEGVSFKDIFITRKTPNGIMNGFFK